MIIIWTIMMKTEFENDGEQKQVNKRSIAILSLQ